MWLKTILASCLCSMAISSEENTTIEEDLEHLFNRYDLNKDGQIVPQEFLKWLSMGETMQVGEQFDTDETMVLDIIKTYDADESGGISLSEWIEALSGKLFAEKSENKEAQDL